MKTGPIVPATLGYTADGIPWSPHYQDIYHPKAGAQAQARHVFLCGNGLPERWQRRDRFVILETGFGLGHNFLATWQAWKDDAARCERLVFISIEQHPCTADDMRRAHAQPGGSTLAPQLIDAWPPLTHNLHSLSFEGGRVQLLLALGPALAWLPELVAQADACYLDGFAPARNPEMWEPRIYKALARMAAPGATLATWTAASSVRAGLQAAGFEVHKAQGSGGKRDITLARYAPAFTPRRAPSRLTMTPSERHAVIVGAGLAGCATAQALAVQGWSCTLLDRRPAPALETSGNPAGLFHGIVNAQDGTHARFNRAAALMAQRVVGQAIAAHGVRAGVSGLLRLDVADADTLHAVLSRLGLPGDYVQALTATQASALSGLPLRQAAWHYPGGGWAQPAGLCRAWLAQAAGQARFQGDTAVARLQRAGPRWQLLDPQDRVIEEAEVVILANAGDAQRLLAAHDWPLDALRGQVSWCRREQLPALPTPRMPIAGAGYLLPEFDGLVLFGATAQAGDPDASIRASDHSANLAQLERLLGHAPQIPLSALDGRTGWRCSAQDRLPLIGAVPDLQTGHGRHDQPRLVPRLPGLYVHTALGSRGLTWAALGAQALAACITGAPVPLESSLLDAIDPARFVSRAARRSPSAPPATPAAGHTPADD